MPDIQLRFNKDMLVLSTSYDYLLARQGFDVRADRAYVELCEPELYEEALRLEDMMGTPCVVAPSDDITRARLAHANFADEAPQIARNAFEAVQRFKPEHMLAAIGPCGLPLDSSSAPSLKQSREQYQRAVCELARYPFDALYFVGFSHHYDLLCALMGARAVYDGVLFTSFKVDASGVLPDGSDVEHTAAMASEYGADVVGVVFDGPLDALSVLIGRLKTATSAPLLVELNVRAVDSKQLHPTDANPYPQPESVIDAALALHDQGVQFVRAAGAATPAYTAALLATLAGLDVRA